MNFQNLLARRTKRMHVNAIREILKVASQPGMISLAGGIPAPESFPLELIAELNGRVLATHAADALQYGLTEGFPPLREALATRLSAKKIPVGPEEVLITSGSQGVLDAIGKTLISPRDPIAVESPTYLGALQAFTPYEPDYLPLVCDDDGLIPDSLEAVLRRRSVKFVYLVPDFQNPTGRTLSMPRRRAVAKIIRKYGTLLVEDDPYGDLRYEGAVLPSLKSLAPENVIYIGTLSKVFAPGLRLGYCVAPLPIQNWLVLVKQGVDLHTATYSQALAAEYIAGGYLDRHLPRIIDLYRPRKEAIIDALAQYFPDGFRWSRPEGGMFVWVEGPEGMDMLRIYTHAVENGVAYVPGQFFFVDQDQGRHTLRLNFTMADGPTLDKAIALLADVMRRHG
ncbi:MAG: PLP-dependent aminotransferase family protein [Desulfobacterales bacterium]|jgi:2-aminoadipate transaminase